MRRRLTLISSLHITPVILILLSGILAACGGAGNQPQVTINEPAPPLVLSAETAAPTHDPTAEPTSTVSALPEEFDPLALGDATYIGILDRAVTLANGRYEGEPFVEGGASRPTVTLLTEPVAYGDLNGDGRMDAATVLVADSGGSGRFVYLAIVEFPDGEPLNTATILLGDREQVRSLTIDGDRLLANLLSHTGDDPACCPSLETLRMFRLLDGQLVDVTTD